jgi:hypothetical protein
MFLVGAASGASVHDVDPDHSKLTVRVSKAGLFRALADNHIVDAPITRGSVDDGPSPAVDLVVNTNKMRVLDPGLSAQDRDQVQARMLGPEVLDASRFSEIRFESRSVEQSASGGWIVHGQLTLHGQTRPVDVKVVHDQGHYKGSASLKQTAFGITPITIAGGTVKVKDEIAVDFDIVTRSSTSPDR